MQNLRNNSESDRASAPAAETRDGVLKRAIAQHPIISSVMLGCTLVGACVGFGLLTGEWSPLRRIAAGAVAGAGVGILVVAPRMIG